MRHFIAPIAGIMGRLDEAVVAATIGLFIGEADSNTVTLLAGVLVLAAVTVQTRSYGVVAVRE